MPPDDWVAAVQMAFLAGRPVALLFDYDGTLAPIAPQPCLATLSDGVRIDLRELARQSGVSVGVISGRGLADVSAMVGVDGLYYAGCGGGEMDLRGVRVESPLSEPMRDRLRAAECEVRDHVTFFPGVWVEPKNRGFTAHYRGASPAGAIAFGTFFCSVMSRYRELRHLSVCRAFEVGPTDGWDKAVAVERILATAPAGAFPVYFGDSENDLPGMAAVRAVGGTTVAIGETVARVAVHRLESPGALHADLSRLRASLLYRTKGNEKSGTGPCPPM